MEGGGFHGRLHFLGGVPVYVQDEGIVICVYTVSNVKQGMQPVRVHVAAVDDFGYGPVPFWVGLYEARLVDDLGGDVAERVLHAS